MLSHGGLVSALGDPFRPGWDPFSFVDNDTAAGIFFLNDVVLVVYFNKDLGVVYFFREIF